MNKKLLIVVNVDWFFLSHRLPIALKAIEEGWFVYLVCEDTGNRKKIESYGIKLINLKISRSGLNLFNELITFFKFYFLLVKIKPNIVHLITIKPVFFGSILTKLFKNIRVVVALSGLGYVFTKNRKLVLLKVLIPILRFSFNQKNIVIIFQNNDDKETFFKFGILNEKHKIKIIKGSGVDLFKFSKSDLPLSNQLKILFPARMLFDKGIKDLIDAALLLKPKYINKIQFILAGMIDKDNRASVTQKYLECFTDGNYIKWIGHQDNMKVIFDNCDIVVLPSYREGLPKSLVDACAIGRPIITTDAIGCRDCVDHEINGLIVPIGSPISIANSIEYLFNDRNLMMKMGNNSRLKAELEFDLRFVLSEHLSIYNSLL